MHALILDSLIVGSSLTCANVSLHFLVASGILEIIIGSISFKLFLPICPKPRIWSEGQPLEHIPIESLTSVSGMIIPILYPNLIFIIINQKLYLFFILHL